MVIAIMFWGSGHSYWGTLLSGTEHLLNFSLGGKPLQVVSPCYSAVHQSRSCIDLCPSHCKGPNWSPYFWFWSPAFLGDQQAPLTALCSRLLALQLRLRQGSLEGGVPLCFCWINSSATKNGSDLNKYCASRGKGFPLRLIPKWNSKFLWHTSSLPWQHS